MPPFGQAPSLPTTLKVPHPPTAESDTVALYRRLDAEPFGRSLEGPFGGPPVLGFHPPQLA